MKKLSKKEFKIITESGKQLFNETYSERGANNIWNMYNGVYTDDTGKEERIYIIEA